MSDSFIDMGKGTVCPKENEIYVCPAPNGAKIKFIHKPPISPLNFINLVNWAYERDKGTVCPLWKIYVCPSPNGAKIKVRLKPQISPFFFAHIQSIDKKYLAELIEIEKERRADLHPNYTLPTPDKTSSI